MSPCRWGGNPWHKVLCIRNCQGSLAPLSIRTKADKKEKIERKMESSLMIWHWYDSMRCAVRIRLVVWNVRCSSFLRTGVPRWPAQSTRTLQRSRSSFTSKANDSKPTDWVCEFCKWLCFSLFTDRWYCECLWLKFWINSQLSSVLRFDHFWAGERQRERERER